MPRSVLIFILLAILILAAAVGVWYLLRYLSYRRGTLAHSRVSSELTRFGVIRNFKILKNLHLTCGDRQADPELVLVGFFGILFVSSVNDTAEYYGDAKSERWTKVLPNAAHSRSEIPNYIQKHIHDIDVVREIFSKNRVYNIRMEGVTVFCGGTKKTLIGITDQHGLMNFSEFKNYLSKSKFDKDNDVDVPALCELLTKYNK